MSAIYAWLQRHRVLVDSVLAAVLFLLSLSQAVSGRWPAILVALVITVPVAFRRRAPILAFAIAAVGGAWQIFAAAFALAGAGPVASDVAILVLIYTVAAYRPRRASLAAVLICLTGSAFAVVVWSPAGAGKPYAPVAGPASRLPGRTCCAR